MPYVLPDIPAFKAQFIRDFPYAVPLAGGGSGVVLTPVIGGANGGIVSVTVNAGGTGFPANTVPDLIVQGGAGTGALLKAIMAAGAIASVTVLAPGYGYLPPPYAPSIYNSNGLGDNTQRSKVTDFDISAAMSRAFVFNLTQSMVSSQAAFTQLYNLLSAHYLCENLQASGAGLGGKAEWVTNSKTVGNVTESYNIPDRVMRSPILSKLSKTTYGSQFLELISPQLIGNIQVFHRNTLP